MIRLFAIALTLATALMAQTPLKAQVPAAAKTLLKMKGTRGATFSMLVRDLSTGRVVAAYDTLRQVTPASVLKLVTTATALELLGPDYRFGTTIEHDGTILPDGTLDGNLFIRGGGDPSLGSGHIEPTGFLEEWLAAIKKAGIRRIKGSVIADERFFDEEGISPKWLYEDMGSYYGAGCYGISAFDNLYRLKLKSYGVGTRPDILSTDPEIPGLQFHNHLTTQNRSTDSTLILGAPFANERYLYGAVPANRQQVVIKGDIPDPALFLATYLTEALQEQGIQTTGKPGDYRLLKEEKHWPTGKRVELVTTWSPPLSELIRVTNFASHNLFADALLKTLGRQYPLKEGERISYFSRGVEIVRRYWKERGVDTSTLWIHDGSGLAMADKISAAFLIGVLERMADNDVFVASIPKAGISGSVRNFLKKTKLEGVARLKSGSMSRVRCYAGYVDYGKKRYAVALFVNNHALTSSQINQRIERILLETFK